MKKADVKIGATYVVKVSGRMANVKIIGESRFGGWDGINTSTRHSVRIKSAQRLRRHVTTIKDMLALEGIKTNQDLYAFLQRNIIVGKSESNYDILVRKFGQNNADRVMRLLEVAECHTF